MTRSAGDVGRGLAPARPATPIRSGERIHVLGAAGAGASAAVLLAHRAGALVNGCDPGGPSPYTAALVETGIDLEWRHSAEHVLRSDGERPQRLAVTKALTAIDPDNAELRAAAGLEIPAEPWQQLIADVAATTGQMLVAVAGTHGKSTTTGWLVDLLVRAGRDPSAFVGALLDPTLTNGTPSTARWGRGDVMLVEADEYAGNFDAYRPRLIVLLNAEWDHPDVFADEEAVLAAFEAWIRGAPNDATLVANTIDPGVARIVGRLEGWPGRIVPVEALPEGSDVALAGPANRANAMAVATTGRVLGVPEDVISASLASFGGVGRRLEVKGDASGVVVLDDYGHHPTAIEKTLAAVRERYPGRPVWAVYEPLTYHRTAAMLDRFAQVLARAEHAVVADIWAGRDRDTSITSALALADAIDAQRGDHAAAAPGSVERTADYLAARVRPGDVVLVMGGGRSYVIADRLVELLTGSKRAAP